MIILDYSDKRPIYEQIVEKYRMLILNGILEADEKIPSVRSLAIELSINPNTIQKAYTELERCGLIYSIKGRGNFVAANNRAFADEKRRMLDSLSEKIKICMESGITFDEVEECLQMVYRKEAGK